MMFPWRLLVLIWFVGFASVAARLPAEELESLSVIAKSLGKRDWSFEGDADPCNGQPPWRYGDDNKVECECSNITTCHITKIYLKSENLSGSLPRELVQLPFLQEIDLTRNYLNGTIPPEWGSMRSLTIIALLGNRLTGPIPGELGDITTLTELVLEANQFSGTIPSEIGNLTQLERLVLTSNNLSGVLPPTLERLTALTEFRISDNNFSGNIPNYIQNWRNIGRIEIQGSGLTGPIPSNLTSLTKLVDLRISDLKGSRSDFPELNDLALANWTKLILRSCNIQGVFPRTIERMSIKDVLDLSFNNFTGQIPPNLGALKANVYLTGNSLSGPVPDQIKTKTVDLAYNNFTVESEKYCTENSLNLFGNSQGNTSDTFFCRQSACKPDEYYFFRINCGSKKRVDDYEGDSDGSSEGYPNWGVSQTGEFMNPGDRYGKYQFTWQSESSISGSDSALYKDARLSPVSLTYYGYCLRNGPYNVTLHFAEIMFTNDTTSSSLGRRIFDVYIQGNQELKDFNIESEAGGVYKAITRSFLANVSDHTMQIRFYWAGKGTTALPDRSVYGPLISAISVVHKDYKPADGLSTRAIVGIVLAVIFTVILVPSVLWWQGCLWHKHSIPRDLRGLDLRTGSFTLRQIRAATSNFDPANKIGEGGFGPVYMGVLLDGTIIAVKQLSSKSKQGNREFVNEIGMISALQHPHLVKLYGCCIESDQLLLVYEYLENNSLARALFGPKDHQLHLDWATRHTICIGIARGLAYLHEESRLKIVHRDIKATNVLLDGNLVPKISDFGLAKLDEEDNTHISTRIAGTFGYMAPEYAMRGYLTDKADVYSFGIVVLEIVSGRSNSSIRPKEESFYLLDWANFLKAKGNLLELVDPRLELNFNKEQVTRAINLALVCTNAAAAERPSMSAVVSMLEGKVVPIISSIDQTKGDELEMVARDGEGGSISMDVPWSGSSTSVSDLYPIAMDTSFWEKRGQ